MKIIESKLSGVKIIEPKSFGDARGYFFESYQREHYQEAGMVHEFVQDNMSRSAHGVVRGLHYQLKFPQGKLVTVTRGEVFDVAVDIRVGSPTFGQWDGYILSDQNHRQLYIPPGFAHGFCVLSELADFHYKCTDYYHPEDDYGILWDDPQVGIIWPKLKVEPNLSLKDSKYPLLQDVLADNLPKFKKDI